MCWLAGLLRSLINFKKNKERPMKVVTPRAVTSYFRSID